MKNTKALLYSLLLTSVSMWHNPSYTQTIAKMSVGISSLECIQQSAQKGKILPLSDANISINDPSGSLSSTQREQIAGVVSRARDLGASHLVNNIKINVHNGGRKGARGTSRCTSYTSSANSIELANNCGTSYYGEGTAKHFAHELGHIIGLRGFYDSYARVPTCEITSYGMTSRREELGEVIATYLLAPEKLQKICPESYVFVQRNGIFRGGGPEGCGGMGSAMLASGSSDFYRSSPYVSTSYNRSPSSNFGRGSALNTGWLSALFAPFVFQMVEAANDQSEADRYLVPASFTAPAQQIFPQHSGEGTPTTI